MVPLAGVDSPISIDVASAAYMQAERILRIEVDVRDALGSSDRNHINRFEKRLRYVPGRRSSVDWNLLKPAGVPAGGTKSIVKLPGNGDYDLHEYPAIGGYGTDSASDDIVTPRVEAQSKLRMLMAEAEHERIEGASTVRTLVPGRRFKPYDVANPGNVFKEHAVLSIVHTAREGLRFLRLFRLGNPILKTVAGVLPYMPHASRPAFPLRQTPNREQP
jgi:uncharacterized protein involved in type VI secretion and phage assembly